MHFSPHTSTVPQAGEGPKEDCADCVTVSVGGMGVGVFGTESVYVLTQVASTARGGLESLLTLKIDPRAPRDPRTTKVLKFEPD